MDFSILIETNPKSIWKNRTGEKDLLTPLMGRNLMERTMDRIAPKGYEHIYIKNPFNYYKLLALLDNGTPWGVNLSIFNKKAEHHNLNIIRPNWINAQNIFEDLKTILCDGGINYDMLPSWPIKPGVWTNRGAQIHPSVKFKPPVYIGENVTISEGCTIGPFVSIEKESYLSEKIIAKNSLIYPNTFCSNSLNIQNCLVDQSNVFDLNRNVEYKVDKEIFNTVKTDLIA